MKKLLESIKGYRTYSVAILIAIIVGLRMVDLMDQEVFIAVIGLLGAGGLATLRSAINE